MHDVSLAIFERLQKQFSRRCCLGWGEFVSGELLRCCGADQPHGSYSVMASRAAESFKAQTSVELQSTGIKGVQLQG